MKSRFKILFFTFLLVSSIVFPQEKEKLVVEASSDQLGNVQDAFQQHFFEALKQKAIENYEKAVDELVQALALDPQPVVYLELGKNYNALQKYSQAAVYLEKGRAGAPKNSAVLEELYKSYFLNKEFDRALPVVRDLSKVKPSFADDLANLHILNENYDLALQLLDSLDDRKGNSTYRESLRRQVYSRTNNVEAQIDDLQENIAEDPMNERDYLNLIFVYSESGRTKEAFETAKKLLEINPSSELVHLALYKFYMNDRNSEKAVQSMKILLGSDQIDEITKYQALNDFLMYVSENPALEDDLVELVEIFASNENNTKVYGQLGTFFLEKGKKDVALDYLVKALESAPDNFALYRDVIKLQVEQEKVDEVLSFSSKALDIFPTQSWLYLMKGTAHNRKGEFSKAEAALNDGLEFLIEDSQMEKEFYRQLVITYRGLELPQKESEFKRKAEQIKTNNG